MEFVLSAEDHADYKLRTLEFRVEHLQGKTAETAVVHTSHGRIRGIKRRALYGETYYSFERIPYAQPPLGELRFCAPKPLSPWNGVLDCTNYGLKACQRSLGDGSFTGSEDCLHLNVYTTMLMPAKTRPVMVWIHGGGFQFGEATPEWYGPDYLMKKDVVLISVQYRLGSLGFLSLDDPQLETPGNAGLKDLIKALEWVKLNCHKFGGNPNCITIFGESAGSMAVSCLMASAQGEDLFHRAILQSGAPIPLMADKIRLDYVHNLAVKVGYSGSATDQLEILRCLRNCTAEELINAEAEMTSSMSMSIFNPAVEPYTTSDTMLTEDITGMLQKSWSSKIPVMIGATSQEGLFWRSTLLKHPEVSELTMNNIQNVLPKAFIEDPLRPEIEAKIAEMRELHFPGRQATAENFYDFMSILLFWRPIDCVLKLRTELANGMATYLYRFDFDSGKLEHPFRIMRCGRGIPGVAHTDELVYLFSSALARRMDLQSREYRTIERMIDLWTTFAAAGDPTKCNTMKGLEWRPARHDDKTWSCLNIGNELGVIDLPEMPKILLWREFFQYLQSSSQP